MKPTVIYLTHTTPSEIGNGGVHRSFQVLHELKQIVGPDNVLLLTDDFRSPLVNNAAPKDLNGTRRQHQPPLKQWASMRAGTALVSSRIHIASFIAQSLAPVYIR